MRSHPQQSTAAGFSLRLKAFYGALFVTLGVQMPFLPVWLAAKGLDARAIGIVLALPMVVRIVAVPLATRVADRRDALRTVIVAASGASVVGFGVLGLTEGVLMIALAYVLASAVYAPVTMLTDAYALRGLAQWGRAYGPVRLWGSAAFIAMSFGAGALLDVIAPRDLIWLIVAAMALTTMSAFALAPLAASTAPPQATPPSASALLRDRRYLCVIAAASFIQASHAVYYGFWTLDWRAAGFDGVTIGALWSLGVLAEIALFALSARLPIAPISLILFGAGGAIVRWTCMALDPPAVLLPVLQCLHALSFGATHLGALGYVARAAPPGLSATAQGYLSVALGAVMAVATAASGALYGRYGSAAYGAMALLASAGALSALVANRLQAHRRNDRTSDR